jgi:fido (protein-threonine AMPylation protein)
LTNWYALGCPTWEYSQFPEAAAVLQARAQSVIWTLLAGGYDTSADTRPVHSEMFFGLTPPNCGYYAGNYRGSNLPCLQAFPVGVPGDSRVGAPPSVVQGAMDMLGMSLDSAIQSLDQFAASADGVATEVLLRSVRIAARLFHEFLTIHPYANGNGHMARFLVWLVLLRYGQRPHRWPIEPRPSSPAYVPAIYAARRGSPSDLEKLILQSIL